MANIYESMNPILDGINRIVDSLSKHSFMVYYEDTEAIVALHRVSNFLNLSETETAVFSAVFKNYYYYNECPVHIGMLSTELNVTPLRILEFQEEFKSLEEKGFIYRDKGDNPLAFSKHYRIPEKVKQAIVSKDEKLLKEGLHVQNRELTYPEKIQKKELFYKEENRKEVDSLSEYLQKDKFVQIQKRLVKKSMSKGVCILFYGDSGTGKTETVYQLAKQSERPVYHVDIGETISQWGGGTTTNLSIIFDKYERFCRQAEERGENIPILLFNEADALFGHRVEQPERSYDIEENRIQSVLLDYIERQEGILVITTNLEKALDSAFERRFLFKIKFEKPTVEIKQKIWENKVSWLDKASAKHLAASYTLSGGEIDNVVRKITIQEILSGRHASINELEDFCQKEKLQRDRNSKIGFTPLPL